MIVSAALALVLASIVFGQVDIAGISRLVVLTIAGLGVICGLVVKI